jgi:hypothetical protein
MRLQVAVLTLIVLVGAALVVLAVKKEKELEKAKKEDDELVSKLEEKLDDLGRKAKQLEWNQALFDRRMNKI